MIRDVIGYNFRPDTAERARAWLDPRLDAYKRARTDHSNRNLTLSRI